MIAHGKRGRSVLVRPVCLVFLGLLASGASGDGAFLSPDFLDRLSGRIGVASTEQKGIMIQLPGDREALLLQTTYHGPAGEFAWVIPVPGKPGRDDVFMACSEFIDEVMARTKPETKTEITDPAELVLPPGHKQMAEAEAAPMMGEAAVTVHERMEVGDYDAAVLSATGEQVLVDWLNGHGYSVPRSSADVLAHYVQKRWYFVALRIRPGVREAKPTLEDVAPIGICFDTEHLVYPLRISRASSREITAVLLIALSKGPLRCEQLTEASLPLDRWVEKGASYATIRRKALAGKPKTAVREFSGTGGVPFTDLHYRDGEAFYPEKEGFRIQQLWATRLWSSLAPSDMEDLTFGPAADGEGMRLVVEREGQLHRGQAELARAAAFGAMPIAEQQDGESKGSGSAWRLLIPALIGFGAYLLLPWIVPRRAETNGLWTTSTGVSGAVLGLLLLVWGLPPWLLLPFVAAVLLATGRLLFSPSSPAPDECGATALADRLHGAVAVAGLAVLLWPLAAGGYDSFGYAYVMATNVARAFLPVTATYGVGQLLWSALSLWWIYRRLRVVSLRSAWIWAAPGLMALAALPAVLDPTSAAAHDWASLAGLVSATTWTAVGTTLAFLVVGSVASYWLARLAQPAWLSLTIVAVVGVALGLQGTGRAYAGIPGKSGEGAYALDHALHVIDEHLQQFRATYGCYPRRLEDLVGSGAPTAGLDSSGNEVPIVAVGASPSAAVQDALDALPTDPLTGRNDTWVYEPTGSPMVDSGGYRIKLIVAPTADLDPPRSYLLMDLPPFGPVRYDEEDRYVDATARQVSGSDGVLGDVVFVAWDAVTDLTRIIANPGARAAYLGRLRINELWLAAPSSEDTEAMFVVNGHRAVQVTLVDLGEGKATPFPLSPWPGRVLTVDRSHRQRQWLIVHQENPETHGLSEVQLVSGEGTRRRIGAPGTYLAAWFDHTGGRALAIVGDELPPVPAPARARLPAPEGKLVALDLKTGASRPICDHVREYVRSTRYGTAFVDRTGQAEKLGVISEKATLSLECPQGAAFIVDAWVGPKIAYVATAAERLARREGERLFDYGHLWRVDLGARKWTPMAKWRWHDAASLMRIVGQDPGRPEACVVCHAVGSVDMGVYVVGLEAPRLEQLSCSRFLLEPEALSVTVDGRRMEVAFDGLIQADGLKTGDLIASWSEGELKPRLAVVRYVTGSEGGRLLAAPRDLEVPKGDLPVLEGTGTHTHLRLRPLSDGT